MLGSHLKLIDTIKNKHYYCPLSCFLHVVVLFVMFVTNFKNRPILPFRCIFLGGLHSFLMLSNMYLHGHLVMSSPNYWKWQGGNFYNNKMFHALPLAVMR